ncbi:MAG TPA: DUF4271 domain-containing protein [Puia sp.]|nr:DUF4271 domain-containing protein [Puia sp.]
MSKSFILLTCLLVSGQLWAQTDTTPPTPSAAPAQPQDTTIHAVIHPIRAMSRRDSLRRDSIRRVRRDSIRLVRRDSISRVRQDSISRVRQDSVARLHPDTVSRDTATAPVVAVGGGAGPGAAPADTGPPVELHHPNSKDTLFYLIVAILFYFASIRLFFEKYFSNLMTLFFRVSLRQQQIREQVLQTPLPSLLLNILFVISAGLYACFLLHYSRWGAGINFWVLYLYCMALLAAIYLVKFVVLKFIGWVFSISRATDIYIFVVFLVNKMLGIFLLPFLIVITFSGDEWRQVFITISLATVFVLWGYRILASYRPVRNEIKLTPFYFFLYLCAFEIAPLLLIYKVLLTYLEKVY